MVSLSSIADVWREHLRLSILRLLREAPGRQLNDSLITTSAHRLGIKATRDQVRTELHWLESQGAVRQENIGGLVVVDLTERGGEVASGLSRIHGIAEPSAR